MAETRFVIDARTPCMDGLMDRQCDFNMPPKAPRGQGNRGKGGGGVGGRG